MAENELERRHGRGFASMDPDRLRKIARKGGVAVPAEKRSFSQNRELAREAGRKGRRRKEMKLDTEADWVKVLEITPVEAREIIDGDDAIATQDFIEALDRVQVDAKQLCKAQYLVIKVIGAQE